MAQAWSDYIRTPEGIDGEDLDKAIAVVQDFERAQKARQSLEKDWKEFYRLYRSYTKEPQKGPDGKPLNKSNLFIPITFGIIESAVPKITGALFEQTPVVGVLPREPGDERAAETMEALLNYQLERMHFQDIVERWVKECLMYGTSVVKVTWRKDQRTMRSRRFVPLPGLLGRLLPYQVPDEYEEDVVEYDGPWVEPLDIWDFYLDPEGTSVDDAAYACHRVFRTLPELEEMERKGIYRNIEHVRAGISDPETKGRWRRVGAINKDIPEDTPHDQQQIELLEYWTDDWVCVVAARSVVIRDEPNPFYHGRKPFVEIIDHPLPHEFYGIGEIEPIRYLQREVNTLRNQTIDATAFSINKMGWYDPDSETLDRSKLYNKANHFVPGIFGKDWGWVPEQLVNPAGIQQEQIARQDIEWILQLFNSSRGQLPERRETATGIAVTQARADERFNNKIRRIEYMGIRRVAQLIVALNQQFLDSQQTIRVLGEGGATFRTIDPQSIIGTFDLIPRGSAAEPLIGKAGRVQRMMEFAAFLASVPPLAQRTDWIKLAHRIGNEIGIRTLEEILPPQRSFAMPALPNGAVPAGANDAAFGMGGAISPQEGDPSINPATQSRGADGQV